MRQQLKADHIEQCLEVAEVILDLTKLYTRETGLAAAACLIAGTLLHFRSTGRLRDDRESVDEVLLATRRAILAIDEGVADATTGA